MGLNKKNANVQYVRMKEGKLFLSSDLETPYDEISGMISNIGIRTDKFEGNDIEKLIIELFSDGLYYSLSINFNTQCASDLIGFLKNVDFTKEVTLIPLQKTESKDGKELKRTSMLVKQGDGFMKKFYTKDTPNGLPPMRQVKISGKIVWDRGEMMDFFKDVIKNELRPQIIQQKETPNVPLDKTIEEVKDIIDVIEDDEDDDLPF